MARKTRHQWLSWRRFAPQSRVPQRPSGACPFQRRPRVEPLEDRRLLSITVDTLLDEADGSIADGDVSLGECSIKRMHRDK
jgi:hypothetical protein